MRRVLITGAGGFLGRHLVRTLAASWQVVATVRQLPPRDESARWLPVGERPDGLATAVDATEPDLLIHAAFVHRKPSGQSDSSYLATVLQTDVPLFDRCAADDVPVLLIGSSAVYGASGDQAITESAPRRPVSTYGLAKTIQEVAAEHVAAARGLRLCTARLFNLVGPGQRRGTVVADWLHALTTIARGGGEPVLRVRHLASRRDFVDVRDAAQAIELLADRFRPSEVFNVASGRAVGLDEVARMLEDLCPVPFRVEVRDSEPTGPDIPSQRGDASRLRALGWQPGTDWRRSVRDLWREIYPVIASSGLGASGDEASR